MKVSRSRTALPSTLKTLFPSESSIQKSSPIAKNFSRIWNAVPRARAAAAPSQILSLLHTGHADRVTDGEPTPQLWSRRIHA